MSGLFETSVKLSVDELLVLDGKCRLETQLRVNEAKQTQSLRDLLPENEAAMVAQIVAAAEKHGYLIYRPTNVTYCPCCKRSDGYYPVKRTSRYKRRGEPDRDRPKWFTAYALERSYITNSVFTGYCDACVGRIKPHLIKALMEVKAQIPQALTGVPSTYSYYENRKCTECNWEGHEGQLGKLRTLMGDGYYPGKCPQCGAENHLFNTRIKHAEGFTLVPISVEVSV